MVCRLRGIVLGGVAVALVALGGCSGPSLSGLEPALAATETEEAPGTRKIGKPYKVGGKWYTPREEEDYDKVGMASWYGPGFHGKSTANGERFNQNAMTAAHPTLPLPSYVRVTHVTSGKAVVVRVNDRGPFSRRRIIDVSKAAAKELGMIRAGKAKVRVEFLGPAPLGGGDEETKLAAKKYGLGDGTAVASAETDQKPKRRGFFGFGKREDEEERPVEVRLAAADTGDAPQATSGGALPGVRYRHNSEPDAARPSEAQAMSAARERAVVLAPQVSDDEGRFGSVSAPVDDGVVDESGVDESVGDMATAFAETQSEADNGAIDAVIAVSGDPDETPSATGPAAAAAPASNDRFASAHDLFAQSSGNGSLSSPAE